MTEQTRADVKTSFPLRWPDYEASKDSYDHENQRKHRNRILLQAEPQIGKTGTYLCLIKLLRLDILGKEKVLSASKRDEGTFYLLKENEPSEKFLVTDTEGKQNWQFPYWKTIQSLPSLNAKAVAPGKYSSEGCFYTHDTEENPLTLMKPLRSAHNYQKAKYEDDFRAFQWHHFLDCSECGLLIEAQEPFLDTIEVMMDGVRISVTCSLPFKFLQDRNLREQLKSRGFNVGERGGQSLLAATNSAPTLTYWIFHPSHRDDPRKCLFNYHHVMQEENCVASFMQVAVVRSAKFEAYRSTWGKILAIFQLPDELPNCDRTADDGGVGYSRLFIQKMAYGLHLDYVFVIDDNVATMREAQFSFGDQTGFNATVLRNEDGTMKMQRCSFLKPLVYLQKIAEGKVNPPDDTEKYEPHPLKEQFENFPLYSYTGPAKLFGDKEHDSYGVLGLLRSVPTVRRPFSRTQVYALVLLNVKTTVEKGVFYRPWPCWEDLRFNDDCDKAGLWVVKCNRYCFYKLQYQDWINNLAFPCIYQWNEESKLEESPLECELPKDLEESVILKHLRNLVETEGHDYCFKGQIGDAGPEDGHTDTEGFVDMAGGGVRRSANCPEGILEGSKRSTETDVEDLQQNKRPLSEDQREHLNVHRVNSNSKKVAVSQKMTPQKEKDQETSQDSKPGKRRKSLYSERTAGKKPRLEGYVTDGPSTSTSEQMDVTHVTPGLSTNVLAKPTELLFGAVHGSPGQDKKTPSKEREFVRSQVTGLTSDDLAYDEGTNKITASIVKLWREKLKQKNDKDLTKETVEKELAFELKELEELDGKGYNALTKACSLPSVGKRLVSHLLNVKKIDVNSQIPPSFNSDGRAAKWLTPGMSALSVAIRRGNVKCVPTFMNRETEIDFRSADHDQNTALHHCVLPLEVPKTAFDRLFRCYRALEWKNMKNVQDKSPLDIAKERWKESDTKKEEKKKEAFEYVLHEMDPGGQWKNK
ncbi:PREDICTED: uncharacterized protein LOC107350090 [Acropora digitifera]|uniref:uncharacterized protein LOC107350090 n=1 Tax=Acropora digitifera TaxID=70779 RepID=UPI00077A723D|nr:PREDICTED: uncharacterized protein LOC107350090 [Acropora digitifera]